MSNSAPCHYPPWMFSSDFLARLSARFRAEVGEWPVSGDVDARLLIDYLAGCGAPWAENRPAEFLSTADGLVPNPAWSKWLLRNAGQRLRMIVRFTHLNDGVFAERFGLPVTSRGTSTAISQIYEGKRRQWPDGLDRSIADKYQFSPRYFWVPELLVPEPWTRLTPDRLLHVSAGLFRQCSERDIRAVAYGQKRLRDLGIKLGLPSWHEPFIAVTYCRLAASEKSRAHLPPPEGIPDCAWSDLKIRAVPKAQGKRKPRSK